MFRSESFHVDLILEGTRTRMRCTGELDLVTTPILKRCLGVLLEQASSEVELDFTGLTCLDSSAISALMVARQQYQAHNLRLYIGKSNPRIDRVLSILRLRQLTRA